MANDTPSRVTHDHVVARHVDRRRNPDLGLASIGMPTNARRHRASVELPRALMKDMQDCADPAGHTVAALCFHWTVQAAQLARHGQGHLLPPAGWGFGDFGNPYAVSTVRWTQRAQELDSCRAVIEAAGSNIPSVLRKACRAYLDAGGDVVGMEWPDFRGEGSAEAA